MIERIARRYESRWLRGYARGKLRSDPVYAAVFELLKGDPRPVLDLGCGIGLLELYLRERGYGAPLHAVDFDGKKIAIAERAAGGLAGVSFEARDVCAEWDVDPIHKTRKREFRLDREVGDAAGRAGVSPAVAGILLATSAIERRGSETCAQRSVRGERVRETDAHPRHDAPGRTPGPAGETPALPGTNPSGHIVLLDLLHYLPETAQRGLLVGIAASVAPGALCLIRATPRDASWRFGVTRVEEFFLRASRWMKSGAAHYLTVAEMLAPFRAQGFDCEVRPLWGRTPFNSHLFICRATKAKAGS